LKLSIIAALADNGVIGRDGSLPWHLPDDLRRFKALTMGHPILMGRRTFESIGRALPGRRNLVLTRGARSFPEGIEPVDSLATALARAGRAQEASRALRIAVPAPYRMSLPLQQLREKRAGRSGP